MRIHERRASDGASVLALIKCDDDGCDASCLSSSTSEQVGWLFGFRRDYGGVTGLTFEYDYCPAHAWKGR